MPEGYPIDWPLLLLLALILAGTVWAVRLLLRNRRARTWHPTETAYGTVMWPKGRTGRALQAGPAQAPRHPTRFGTVIWPKSHPSRSMGPSQAEPDPAGPDRHAPPAPDREGRPRGFGSGLRRLLSPGPAPEQTAYGTVMWPKGHASRPAAGVKPAAPPAEPAPFLAPLAVIPPPVTRVPAAVPPSPDPPLVLEPILVEPLAERPASPLPLREAPAAVLTTLAEPPPRPSFWDGGPASPLAPVRPVRPGASAREPLRATWTGTRMDRTVWQLGKVKVMMPKKDRTLLKLLPIPIALGIGGSVYLAFHLIAEMVSPASVHEKHVEARFKMDQLVPPTPLPPLFFRNSERPELERANRDWSRLDPEFRQALLRVMARLDTQGRHFVLIEGYRSPEYQEYLKSLGPAVTRAGADQSQHQRGLAADLAPVRNGALSLNEKDPWTMEAYKLLGKEAAVEGLVWGGSWTTLHDYGHVEVSRKIR